MRAFLILLAILTARVTGEEDKVTFWEEARRRGANVDYTYGSGCVNLATEWRNRASSIASFEKCVKLFSGPDCTGESRLVHRGSYMQFLQNLDNKVVSFRKCTSHDVLIKLDERPRYYIHAYDQEDYLGNSLVIEMRSGECKTLPNEWRKRISSVMTLDQCYVFYDDIDCKGRRKQYFTPFSAPIEDLERMNFDKVAQSVEPCDLRLTPPFSEKFIQKGSFEYTFWRYFFSIYSRAYRTQFEDRVHRSKDGFISWDFLFAANTSAPSIGHQYQDAFENVFVLLRYLLLNRPGKLGFNTENIETLADLALPVYNERMSQKKEYKKQLRKEEWDNHHYAVLIQMETEWYWLKWYLEVISSDWNPQNSNDICGTVENKNLHSTVPLVSDGYVATYGEDPWHAAIYRIVTTDEAPLLICGANIISSTALLSAAHCFYNEALKKALNATSEYEIYVGKYTRTYSNRDSDSQKIHKIRELLFSPNGYNPTLTKTYGSDIILIILENPIQFDQHVRPVCLDWSGSVFADASPLDKQIGRVVGWGSTTGDKVADASKASEYLLTAELPYISYSNCLGKVEHTTSDKFCGGADTGPAVRRGDSGGGFVFKYVNRYYIRGIVSTRDVDSKSSVNTFTDVSFYISWIRQNV